MSTDPRDDHRQSECMRLAIMSLSLDGMEEIMADKENGKVTLNKTENGYQALKELLAQVKVLPVEP